MPPGRYSAYDIGSAKVGVAGKCRAARILDDGAFTIQLRHDRRIMRFSLMSNKFTLSHTKKDPISTYCSGLTRTKAPYRLYKGSGYAR
jgi:hypothetical protein